MLTSFDSDLPVSADAIAPHSTPAFGGSSITADSLQNSSPNIAFIDTRVADIETLMSALENTQIVLLDSRRSGIEQVTATLASYENLNSIQIFSHGTDGLLQLGDSLLSANNIADHRASLQQWSAALSAQADLMIYACNLVAGSQGQALINQIAAFTGADVAASNDITGQSGDWQLEVATGDIESESVLSSIVQDLYEGDLALLNNGDFEQGLDGWRTISGPGAITTDAVSGSSALELNGSSRGVRQTLSASGGSLYTLTGSGKTSSSGNTSIGITFYDQDFNRLAGRGQKIRTPNWQAFSIQEEAPTDTAYVRVWSYKSDNSGSFFLDNLDLSSTLVGPVTPPSSGSELLKNSGFESGLNRWRALKGTERVVNTGAFAGSGALQLSTAGSGTRQIVEAIAGQTYKISGYGKRTGSDYVGFGVTFYDAANKKIAGSGGGRSVKSSSWQRYETEAVAPDNARFARFWTYKSTDNGDGFLDQLSLVIEGGSTPGDTTAPNASLNAANLTIEGRSTYEFTVTYDDETAVDVSTLGAGDIRITGPNGYSQLAEFVQVNNSTDGPSRTATYRVNGPGGIWNGDDNGLYSVFLEANQVSDTNGNAVGSRIGIGDFNVTLRSDVLPLGNLNGGVAARDNATGTGYLMHSEELVGVRFVGNGPIANTASNLIVVQHVHNASGEQWYYDTNNQLVAFTPRASDRLLAELNFDTDTATLLAGTRSTIHGIDAGYASGNLSITPNVFEGSSNPGEFGLSGSQVTLYSTGSDVPGQLTLESSTASVDEATGTVTLTVNRVGGSDGVISVEYATTGVSATDGEDFSGIAGTLTFADGQTSRTLSIPIINDTQGEADEAFILTLNNATNNATIGLGSTVITIGENDGGPNANVPDDLLPDLRPIAATSDDYFIDTNEIPGQVLLRLSTEVANIGDGPLELWSTETSAALQPVFQRIYDDELGSRDVLAGEFVNYTSHGHFHFEGFALYNLREVNTDGSVGDIVGSGGKTSFCLININQPFPQLTDAAIVADGRGGDNCGFIQGVDVGYSDVYGRNLPNQWVDITNVEDGTYWLEITTDPDNNIIEADETNNTDYIQVTIDNPRFA